MRALSVLAVILFHLNLDWIKGGFLGVDVFFVISGFLITYNIVSDLERQQFSLLRFWKKRISRLYPALSFMVVVVVLFVSFVYLQEDKHPVRVQSVASYLSFQNFYLTFSLGDYWSTGAERMPFLHTWSLSVEEQFYLLYPLCLYLLYRLKNRRLLVGILIVAMMLSFAGFVHGSLNSSISAFYLLPTRMWELIAGSLLALSKIYMGRPSEEGKRLKSVGGFAGSIMVVIAFLLYENGPVQNAVYYAMTVLGACLMIWAGEHSIINRKVWSQSLLVYVGRLSYSLYLWHWPVVVFNRYASGEVNGWFVVVVTTLLSMVSYYLVEKPLRRSFLDTIRYPLVFVSMIALSQIALYGFRGSLVFSGFEYLDDEKGHNTGSRFEAHKTILKGDGLFFGDREGRPLVCLIGSSHARMYGEPILKYCEEQGYTFLSLATSGIGVAHLPNKRWPTTVEVNQLRLEIIQKLQPEVVILGGRWVGESTTDEFERRFSDILEVICENSKLVVLVGQIPQLDIPKEDNADLRGYLRRLGKDIREFDVPVIEAYSECNPRLKEICFRLNCDNLVFVDPYDLMLLPEGNARIFNERRLLYFDRGHLNEYGAAYIFDRLLRDQIK